MRRPTERARAARASVAATSGEQQRLDGGRPSSRRGHGRVTAQRSTAQETRRVRCRRRRPPRRAASASRRRYGERAASEERAGGAACGGAGEQRDGDRPEERDDLLNEGTNDRPTASRARARVGVRERQHNVAWTRAAAAVSRRRPRPRRCLRCAVERSLPPKRRDRAGRAVSAARGSARASAWVACLGPAPLFQSFVALESRKERRPRAGSGGGWGLFALCGGHSVTSQQTTAVSPLSLCRHLDMHTVYPARPRACGRVEEHGASAELSSSRLSCLYIPPFSPGMGLRGAPSEGKGETIRGEPYVATT